MGHEKKGQADLLRAFAERFAGDPSVRLGIGGDGPERGRLHELAGSLAIAEQVDWLGALDRDGVRQAMCEADAFVLPSRLETFGVVVIEALACGLPVVATRSGGAAVTALSSIVGCATPLPTTTRPLCGRAARSGSARRHLCSVLGPSTPGCSRAVRQHE